MRYHNITHSDMLNGIGLRVVLWVSGCEHECRGCHNKITWNIEDGIEFGSLAKNEIFEQLQKDYISGITFSGGDPLHIKNRDDVTKLIKEIRLIFPNKNIWVYTGYLWGEVYNLEVMKYIDVLIDGRYEERCKDNSLKFRGSSNQRIIDVKESIREKKAVILHLD